MSATVVFIHTIEGVSGRFDQLMGRLLPDARAVHIADGTIIRTIVRAGRGGSGRELCSDLPGVALGAGPSVDGRRRLGRPRQAQAQRVRAGLSSTNRPGSIG